MTHNQQHQHNQAVIHEIVQIMDKTHRIPAYKGVISVLNHMEFTTTRGQTWTCRRLYRMLQREGHSGLHGLRGQARN